MVFSRDFIGEEVFSYGVYEKNEIRTIIASLDYNIPETNALDIGANIGNHTLQFSKYFKNVHCFEPNKTIYDVLKINTRNRTNTHLYNFGLSNETTQAYLNIPEFNFGGASITSLQDPANMEISLNVYDEVMNVDFSLIKIDVEGHELKALQGMTHAIAKYKPIICFELINSETSDKDLINGLRELGYQKFYIPHIRGIFGRSNSFVLTFINAFFFVWTFGFAFKNVISPEATLPVPQAFVSPSTPRSNVRTST